MELHKCKVFKCKLYHTTSEKYSIYDYYKIKIYHNNIKQYFYIRYNYGNNSNYPFSNFYNIIMKYSALYPIPIFIKNLQPKQHLLPPKREKELEFYKYINIYPDIIQLFESKDEYSVRIGLEILKQQLEINIQ